MTDHEPLYKKPRYELHHTLIPRQYDYPSVTYSNNNVFSIKKCTTPNTESYVELYPSGNIKITGTFMDGQKHGSWTTYYEDGNICDNVDYFYGNISYYIKIKPICHELT